MREELRKIAFMNRDTLMYALVNGFVRTCKPLSAICVAVFIVMGAPYALAQTPDFRLARAWFSGLPVEARYDLQMRLIAAGYSDSVSTDNFSTRIFNSIVGFQVQSGFQQSGMLDALQQQKLRQLSDPVLSRWGLQRVVNPRTGTPLWIPKGLGLVHKDTKWGISYEQNGHIRIDLAAYPSTTIMGLQQVIEAWHRAIGVTVDQTFVRRDFVVVTGRGPNQETYTRFHLVPGGTVGFAVYWSPQAMPDGRRLAVLMSDLFRSFVVQHLDRSPPLSETMATAHVSSPHEPPPKRATGTSGTGFFVSRAGHLMTNAHVVDACRSIIAKNRSGRTMAVRLIATDKTNDLALLQGDEHPYAFARFRRNVRMGEEIAAFGYPLAGLLSTNGNFTKGVVSATAGLRDDTRLLQISAAIQPGNSGGPLLDRAGNIVGVVVGKLNAIGVLAAANDLPQNVNFAIKSDVALSFLSDKNVGAELGDEQKELQQADLADRAKGFSVYLECEQ